MDLNQRKGRGVSESGVSGRAVRGRSVKPQRSRAKRIGVAVGKGLLTVFLVFVITTCIVIGAVVFYVVKVENPGTPNLSNVKLDYTSIVYANDPKTGKPVEVQRLYRTENRIWVDLGKIPENMQNAFVSTEDQRFYGHEGVDWGRTFKAFGNLFLHFYSTNQGASTITQQLVKNVEDIDSSKLSGKVQQILMALNTEKQYSKDQILEAYLNTIPLGENCYGVQTASNLYFGKNVNQLDLAQCAAIACITKSPAYYDPLKHPDHNYTRRLYVLSNMLSQGKITQTQYEQAKDEKLVFSKNTSRVTQRNVIRSYFVDQVITDVTNDLISQKGYSKAYAQSLIFEKGLKIYTTMNPNVQSIADKVYSDNDNFEYQDGKVKAQSSMVLMDYSGGVVAMEGGIGKKPGNMVLNRATQSTRQPGSSIKPLAVYAPALDLNLINWSTMVDDAPVSVINQNGEQTQWPQDDDYFLNYPISVTQALAMSKNTVAVRICQKLDPSGKRSFDFLTNKLGFNTLVKSWKDPSSGKIYSDIHLGIAIGSITKGVTAEEMAGGYTIFGNGGKFYKTHTYSKVTDNQGNTLLSNEKLAGKQVIGADTSFIMNKLLQADVTRSDGTGKYAKFGNLPIGGKTGTTDDWKDRWFVGMTPYYVGAVWFGYDQPKFISKEGTNPALLAWKQVMQAVSSNLPYKDFPTNGSVYQANYNLGTGQVVNYSGSSTDVGWYRLNDSNANQTFAVTGDDYTSPAKTSSSKNTTSSKKPPSSKTSTASSKTSSSSKSSSAPSSSGSSAASSTPASSSGGESSSSVASSSSKPATTTSSR